MKTNRRLDPSVVAKQAVNEVRDRMAECKGSDREIIEAFNEEFDAMIEGWKMKLEELDAEENE